MSSLAERVQVGTPVIWYDDEEWPYPGVVETIHPDTGEIVCRFEFDVEDDEFEPGQHSPNSLTITTLEGYWSYLMSLAERVWSTLKSRETAERLCKGKDPMGIIELERMADDQITLLTEWLADQAELLYFGGKR